MQAFWVKGDKSKAVPFLDRPPALDGSLPGDVGFDPLGISTYFDVRWMREAELKHGRVCMLAVAGTLVQEFVHLPGEAFSKKVAIEAWAAAPRGGMIQILIAIGLIELVSNRSAPPSCQSSLLPATRQSFQHLPGALHAIHTALLTPCSSTHPLSGPSQRCDPAPAHVGALRTHGANVR